jgi:O-antigen/teichoic acid export membrane protein
MIPPGEIRPRAIPPGWRRAAVALSLLWLATAASVAMVFLAQTLLARRLGPSAYGLFASSLATVTMIAPLAGFGLSQFRLKAYGVEGWAADRWLQPSLRFTAVTTSLAVGLVVAWALLIAPADATRTTLLVLSTVVLGVLAVELVGSKLRLEERYRELALWQLLMPGGRLAVALTLLLVPGLDVGFVASGYGAVAVAMVLLAWPQLRAVLRGEMQLHGHGPRDPLLPRAASPGAMSLWSQAWAYGLAAVLYPVFFQLSTVLLKYLKGDVEAGMYGVALAVMTAIYLLPATIYQKFLLSKLHRWAAHDRPTFWRVYRRGNAAMLVFGIAVGVALAAAAPTLVAIAFGEGYRRVAGILAVLALCVPIRFLSTAVGAALLTEDHMRYRVRAMAMATVVAVALNAVLIPFFDEFGAASATVASEAVLLLAMYRGVRRFNPAPTA